MGGDEDGVPCKRPRKAVDGSAIKRKGEAWMRLWIAGSQPPWPRSDALPGEAPQTAARLLKVYNLDEISAIRKGFSPRPAKEEPTIHDWVERPGAWDSVDILRDYKIF